MGLDDPNTKADAAEGATTPAPAEPAASVSKQEPSKQAVPDISGDPWAGFGEEKDTDEKVEAKSEKPDGKDEKKEGETEPDPEEKALDEAFGDKEPDEADDDKKKPAEGKPTEEDLDKQDPKEMIASQRNATAKAWAERAERVYKPTVDFKYGNLPVNEFHDRLGDFLGEDRAGEFASYEAHRLVDENPDGAFHRIYALKMLAKDPAWEYSADKVPSLDDLVSGKLAPVSEKEPKTVATAYDVPAGAFEEATKHLDSVIDWDWRDPELDDQFVDEREKAMAQTIRTLEQTAKAATSKESELADKLSKLSKQVEGLTETAQTEEQKRFSDDTHALIKDYKTSIETKMLAKIERKHGLEIHKDDTEEVKSFKQRKMDLFRGNKWQRDNNQDTDFEIFAFESSKVGEKIREVTKELCDLKAQQALALINKDKKTAGEFEAKADKLRIDFYNLYGDAEKEYSAINVEPDIALLGLKSKQVAAPILEAAGRRETVATGGGISTTQQKQRQYETADDVWNSMTEDAAEEERQQRAA